MKLFPLIVRCVSKKPIPVSSTYSPLPSLLQGKKPRYIIGIFKFMVEVVAAAFGDIAALTFKEMGYF